MDKAIKLYENLVENVNSSYQEVKKDDTKEVIKPSFI